MANQFNIHDITERIRSANRRLDETRASPRNTDRALCGALAVVSFAGVTGHSQDVKTDPETVLVDLLADLMHWSDSQKASAGPEEPIDFELALERARKHYNEEYADEQEQLRADRR